MKKVIWTAITAAAFVLLSSAPGLAQQTATASVTATATVSAKANLSVAGAVAFADADPDANPTIDAAALNVTVKARTTPNGAVTLTVQAGGDLSAAGGAAIPINNLTWQVTGAGFTAGTADSGSAVSVGSWSGPGTRNGTQTYRLVNSWAYATGSYSVTLTYTLTSP